MQFLKNKYTLITSLMIAVIIIFAGSYSGEKFIVNDSSVATGDSVVSGWVYIGSSPNVALSYSIEDTLDVDFTVRYRFGTEPHIALTLDSVNTTGTTLTGKSLGKVLRGYGLTTDLIPGANYIYVKALAITGQANSAVKVGLMTAD